MRNAKFTDAGHKFFCVESDQVTAVLDANGAPTGETTTTTIIISGAAETANPKWVKILEDKIPVADYAEPPKQPKAEITAVVFWAVAGRLANITRKTASDLVEAWPEDTVQEAIKKDIVLNVINGDAPIRYDNKTLRDLVASVGMTDEQFDELWAAAEQAEAEGW